jgi:hypothetical protein
LDNVDRRVAPGDLRRWLEKQTGASIQRVSITRPGRATVELVSGAERQYVLELLTGLSFLDRPLRVSLEPAWRPPWDRDRRDRRVHVRR